MKRSILFKNAGKIVGVASSGPYEPLSGNELNNLTTINNGWMLVEDSKISAIGSGTPPQPDDPCAIINLEGRWILPGFYDAHTHLIYAGSREQEWLWRLEGLSYKEIAKRGGGILNSAKRFRESPDEVIIEEVLKRLQAMLEFGTVAVEIKTGYGLYIEQELRAIELLQKIKKQTPVKLVITLQALHAIPHEYLHKRHEYLRLVCESLLPQAKDMIDFCDVFCEEGFFSVEECEYVLEKANELQIPVKAHVHQFKRNDAIRMALRTKCHSIDHLEVMNAEDIALLEQSDFKPVCVLLPASSYFLKKTHAPARLLIDSNLPVAIASDYNPGTAPTGNMYFVWHLACHILKLTPAEALNAMTINGAMAMQMRGEGCLYPGGPATFQIIEAVPSLEFIPYEPAMLKPVEVWIEGRKVFP